MKFDIYRLFYKKVLAVKVSGNIDSRYFDDAYTRTEITFKGRNEEEAMKKAHSFWKKAQFGMGSFILRKE